MDYLALIKDFGLPVTLVVFFVIQGTQRENRMNARLDELTKFQQQTLIKIIADQNTMIQKFEELLGEALKWFRNEHTNS
jgi:hypothetical protein